MEALTISSEQARVKMRDILDDVLGGREVIIERYAKPIAVVVNFKEYQSWKKRWLAMLDEASADVRAGNYLTQEQVEEGLRQRNLID